VTRLLSAILVLSVLMASASCRGFFVREAVRTSRLQGSVDIVELGNVVDGTGGTIQVTSVTFLQDGVPFTIDFCDDQVVLFPLAETVLVNFDPGQFCATVVFVTVIV
jgi:hypothetical protein